MGILKGIEKKEQQRRRNGVPARVRKVGSEAEEVQRSRLKEKARNLAREHLLDAVDLWVWTLNSPTSTWAQKNEAAVQLHDRFGFARSQNLGTVEDELGKTMTLEIVKYPPPPGWNGDEPAPPAETNGSEPEEEATG